MKGGSVEFGEAGFEFGVLIGEFEELGFEGLGLGADVEVVVLDHLLGDACAILGLASEQGNLAEEIDAQGAGQDDEGDEGDVDGDAEGSDLGGEGGIGGWRCGGG